LTLGVDLHSDLLLDVVQCELDGRPGALHERHLEPLHSAGVRVQVLAVWTDPYAPPETALGTALRTIAAAHRAAEASGGALRLVTTADELDAALEAGALAGVLALEGCEPLFGDPGLLDVFVRLGVRMASLTWNGANAFADGAGEARDAGLSAAGRRLVARMGELGVAVDLAHLSRRGCSDVLELAGGLVLGSHCNADAVFASTRNLPDEVVAEVARRGGVVGLNFLPVFAGPGDVIERLADHHDHLAAVGGPAVVACGADLVGFLPPVPAGEIGAWLPPDADLELGGSPEPPRERCYADLAAELRRRGRDEATIDAVLGANALAFLRRALTSSAAR
jgi:membrane dipeptidase